MLVISNILIQYGIISRVFNKDLLVELLNHLLLHLYGMLGYLQFLRHIKELVILLSLLVLHHQRPMNAPHTTLFSLDLSIHQQRLLLRVKGISGDYSTTSEGPSCIGSGAALGLLGIVYLLLQAILDDAEFAVLLCDFFLLFLHHVELEK